MLQAQQEINSNRSPLFTDVYFPVGFLVHGNGLMTTQDWRNLMPGSEILDRALPDKESDLDDFDNANGSAAFETSVGLDLARSKGTDARFEKQLRLGVMFNSRTEQEGYWERSFTGPYDTLISSITGNEFLVDTTWTEAITARYNYSRVGLSASYILRKRTPGILSWYVGLGGLAGTTIGGSGQVDRRVGTTVEGVVGNDDYPEFNDRSDTRETEEFHIASTGWGAVYALGGLDLQFGRKHPFWSTIHVFSEMRPTLFFNTVPGSPMRSSGAFQQLVGLRLDLR